MQPVDSLFFVCFLEYATTGMDTEIQEPDGRGAHARAYDLCVKHICQQAREWADARQPVDRHARPRPIWVFDIDGTAVVTYWPPEVTPVEHPVITPVLELYKHVQALGYGVVFVTARSPAISQETVRELTRAGYTQPLGIVFPAAHQTRTPDAMAQFKSEARAVLAQRYRLVACMGDQAMDVAGGPVGERQFLLPHHAHPLPVHLVAASCLLLDHSQCRHGPRAPE